MTIIREIDGFITIYSDEITDFMFHSYERVGDSDGFRNESFYPKIRGIYKPGKYFICGKIENNV